MQELSSWCCAVVFAVTALIDRSHVVVVVCRSERLAKYNQLLRIEEELGSDAGEEGIWGGRRGCWHANSMSSCLLSN